MEKECRRECKPLCVSVCVTVMIFPFICSLTPSKPTHTHTHTNTQTLPNEINNNLIKLASLMHFACNFAHLSVYVCVCVCAFFLAISLNGAANLFFDTHSFSFLRRLCSSLFDYTRSVLMPHFFVCAMKI